MIVMLAYSSDQDCLYTNELVQWLMADSCIVTRFEIIGIWNNTATERFFSLQKPVRTARKVPTALGRSLGDT
jgi:hypothetical protein